MDEGEIRALLAQGNKIEAIRVYRESTGLGLKEAKDAVEALERGETPLQAPTLPAASAAGIEHEIRALLPGNKIQAIKVYRDYTGVGLAEAKDAIEAMAVGGKMPPVPSTAPRTTELSLWEEIDPLLKQGQNIAAIRIYRERTGIGLKESKDAVDQRIAVLNLPSTGSRCFIATAAYGAPFTSEVRTLRRFRDEVLQRTPGGRLFTAAYYQLSPPLARLLAGSPVAKRLVRWALQPLVRRCREGIRSRAEHGGD